jgi:hypothetical protein
MDRFSYLKNPAPPILVQSLPVFKKDPSTSQLSYANYLGYVRDSGKNIENPPCRTSFFSLSILLTDPFSMWIYVATCTDNKMHYYAVMVMISTGIKIKPLFGSNSLKPTKNINKGTPQPIYKIQLSSQGDINYE